MRLSQSVTFRHEALDLHLPVMHMRSRSVQIPVKTKQFCHFGFFKL